MQTKCPICKKPLPKPHYGAGFVVCSEECLKKVREILENGITGFNLIRFSRVQDKIKFDENGEPIYLEDKDSLTEKANRGFAYKIPIEKIVERVKPIILKIKGINQ